MILAIIQARMGSTRLPGKVLKKLQDKSVIEHVVNRVQGAEKVDHIIVATSIDKNNLPLVQICAEKGVSVFVGSEDDVLDRFYQAAKLLVPDHIVRITADCPLIDPEIIDMVIEKHLSSDADYTSNTLAETYPDGEDIEVFTFLSLKRAWEEAKLKSEREHVTPFIKNTKNGFTHQSILSQIDYSQKRWTLDNAEDFIFISKIYEVLYENENSYFGMNEILNLLKSNPELEVINSGIKRNEGYKKSLESDKLIKE